MTFPKRNLQVRGDKPSPNWPQFSDRNADSGDEELLATIQGAHDLTALVSQLPLRNSFCNLV